MEIVDRSGPGKSRLLHLIAGLLRPESGEILVNGSGMCGSAHGAKGRPQPGTSCCNCAFPGSCVGTRRKALELLEVGRSCSCW